MRLEKAVLKGGDITGLALPMQSALGLGKNNALSIQNGSVFKSKDGAWNPISPGVDVPGPTTLIGDTTVGFFGEVSASEFIDGETLANSLGLGYGDPIYIDHPWLKCSLDGKIVFIPKRAIRNNITWLDIYNVGAVFGDDSFGSYPPAVTVKQDASIKVNGNSYRVRLLKGSGSDSFDTASGYDTPESVGSEWNRLLYRLCATMPDSQTKPNLAQYTEIALGVADGNDYGLVGQWSYCMESYRGKNDTWLKRGGYGIDSAWATGNGLNGSGRQPYNGWRPVLELIP